MSSTTGGQKPELSGLLDSADIASRSSLETIVARSRHKSLQRLKIVTSMSVVLALGAIGVAILRNGSSPTTSASKTFSSDAPNRTAKAPAWAASQRRLGAAPSGLAWTGSAAAGASGAAAPNVLLPATGTALCVRTGCSGVGGDTTTALTRLFSRTSGDITIRAFTLTPGNGGAGIGIVGGASSPPVSSQTAPSATSGNAGTGNTGTGNAGTGNTGTGNTGVASPPNVPIATCTMSEQLQVEVSNAGAVGSISVPLWLASNSSTNSAFDVVESSAVGVPEGAPIEVITVHVGATVNSVQATFNDGTSDEMTVVDGWAVLVDDAASPFPVRIEALDATGLMISSSAINNADALAEPPVCVTPLRETPLNGPPSSGTPTGAK